MSGQPNTDGSSIELRITEISQLFHTLDPFPFRDKDLDKDAEEFIVGWARETPSDQPLRIVVHLPEAQARTPAAAVLPEALSRYFAYRAQVASKDLAELLRIGRRMLLIGLAVLCISTIAAQFAVHLMPDPLGSLAQESLAIFGWVANWRPLETFLYGWLPIVRGRDLFRRLAEARVDLEPYKT